MKFYCSLQQFEQTLFQNYRANFFVLKLTAATLGTKNYKILD